MGRIKTVLIKRVSKSLLEKYPDRFSPNFEENKKVVNELLVSDSKKLKSQIAGHITRLMRPEKGDITQG